MSAELEEDPIQNTRELAVNQGAPTVKRPLDGDSEYPAKRMNLGDSFSVTGVCVSPDNVVEAYCVPESTVGLVIGRGGEQISIIQNQSGARVQMAPSGSEGRRECTLQGPKPAVERAKQLIDEVINRTNSVSRPVLNANAPMGHTTIEILIPFSKCGLVIGKMGETIKSLQSQSGAKIVMVQESQENCGHPKPLRISGTPSTVECAKRLVEDVINSRDDFRDRYPTTMGDHLTAKGEVLVPRSAVGIIIGKGGETIKRLGMETGTKIQFKPDDDPSKNERSAVITGTREQIYKATSLITDLVNKSSSQTGEDTFYMHVPSNKTGLVIGKGGETIKQINAESGAHCELSRDTQPNANEKIFVIRGSPYSIHHAQHIIRVKVGDIPPGTPVPPFHGPGAPNSLRMENSFNSSYGSSAPQQYAPVPQWSQPQTQNYGSGMGWSGQLPQQPYYDSTQAITGQMQQYQQQQQPQQYQVPQQQQQLPQPVAPSVTANQPAINPQTGQPDYSAQWAEYYRSMGMIEQANAIESQMKQPTQPAHNPTAPYAQQMQQPQGGSY